MAVLLLENFETPGYENTWAETIGSGNSIDDANTDITPFDGTYVLQSLLAGTNIQAYATYDMSSSRVKCYATTFFRIDSSSSTADTGQMIIFSIEGAVHNARVEVRYTATRGWHLFYRYYDGGNLYFSNMKGDTNNNLQLSTDTWYRLGIYYSDTDDEATAILWNASGGIIDQQTVSLTTARIDSQYINIGCYDVRTGVTELFYDYVQANDANWPSLPSTGNPWYYYSQQ